MVLWFCKHTLGHAPCVFVAGACGRGRPWTLAVQPPHTHGATRCSLRAAERRIRQDEGFVCSVSLINVGIAKTNDRRRTTELLCTPGWRTISTIVASRAQRAGAVLGGLANQDSLPHLAFCGVLDGATSGVSTDHNNAIKHNVWRSGKMKMSSD